MKKRLFLLFFFVSSLSFSRAGVVEFADGEVTIKTNDASYTEENIDGRDVLKARLEPSEKWAFVRILPQSGTWDLSKYSGLEVQITNNGATPIKPGLRMDEATDIKHQAWNSAMSQPILPGQTGTVRVKFGIDYNMAKSIDTSRIGAIQIFLGKDRQDASELIISDIKAVE